MTKNKLIICRSLCHCLKVHGEFTEHLQNFKSDEMIQLNHEISTNYFVLLDRLQTHDTTVRNSIVSNDHESKLFTDEYIKVGNTIRQVTIKVGGQPPHQTYQELYFQVPESCAEQESSQLVNDYFRKYFFDVDYLEQPWSQRHISMLNQMDQQYKEVHDHQKYMDDSKLIHAFQKMGRLTDLWTLFQTIAMNMLLMYGAVHPTAEQTQEDWTNQMLRVGAYTHVITSSIKTTYFFSQMPFVFARIKYRHLESKIRAAGCLKKCHYYSSVAIVLFGDVENVYMVLYLSFSWLGLAWNYFFFAFHLLEFVS